MHRMYHSLAKKYMERMHFDKAYEKLEKAAEWNRVDMDIYWEKTECLKQLGELKKLKETTKEPSVAQTIISETANLVNRLFSSS